MIVVAIKKNEAVAGILNLIDPADYMTMGTTDGTARAIEAARRLADHWSSTVYPGEHVVIGWSPDGVTKCKASSTTGIRSLEDIR